MTESPRSKVQSPKPGNGDLLEEIKRQVAELTQRVEETSRRVREFSPPLPARGFNDDDASFLIWVLGFTAGANLDRDGERGERIFARCRDLQSKFIESRRSAANPS